MVNIVKMKSGFVRDFMLVSTCCCFVLFMSCSLLYPITLEEFRLKQIEFFGILDKFEQIERDDLLKGESLRAEWYEFCNRALSGEYSGMFAMLEMAQPGSMNIHLGRLASLEKRMNGLLAEIAEIERAEQGDIDAQLRLSLNKLADNVERAAFEEMLDKFEQVERDDLWDVSIIVDFFNFYAEIKKGKDYDFFDRLEEKERDGYRDRLSKLALSVVEWVNGLEYDKFEQEERRNFLDKHDEFLELLSI